MTRSQKLNRLFVLVPYFKGYLATLKRCPTGRPNWVAYTLAKREMSQYIGWDAEPEKMANLTPDQVEEVMSSPAYEAMIEAITTRLNV